MSEHDGTAAYRHRGDALSSDRGAGAPVIFSHGTLMDRRMFAPQVAALSDGYRTIAYDSRARTDRYADTYDLDDLADDCAALMDFYGIESAVLVGMSMGGFMGLRFALRYPERLDGLVLVDSMASPHPAEDRETYRGFLDQLRDADAVPEELAGLTAPLLFGETSMAERRSLVDTWVDRWQTYPAEAVINEVESWLDRAGCLDRLGEIDVPALVVHGAEDASIEPAAGARTAEALPNGRMARIPDAGHSSNLENPEAVNAELRGFLDGLR
jgi:pimeloyl-ACP methyl ester carboxylesterase